MSDSDVLEDGATREPAQAGPRSRLYTDTTVAFVLILLCAVVYYLTTLIDRVPEMLLQGMQAATYPQVVLVALVLLTGLMLFESRRQRLKTSEPVPPLVYATIAAMAFSLAVSTWIDFFGGLILFIAVTVPLWGMRRPVLAISYGIVFALAINALFALALGVRFPHGPLTSFIG